MGSSKGRWVSLTGGIYLATCCAVNYSFGVFSPLLKDTFNFSQSNVNLVGTLGNLGMYFTLPAGVFFDRFQATRSIMMGMIIQITGFALMYLTARKVFTDTPSPWLFGAFYAISSQAQGYLDTSGLCTNMYNFPAAQGQVIGIQKAFNGLGAAFFAALFQGFCQYSNDYENRVMFIGLVPCVTFVLSLGALFAVHRVDEGQRYVTGPAVARRFYYAYAIALLLALYTTGTAMLEAIVTLGNHIKLIIGIGLIVIFSLFLVLPTSLSEKLCACSGSSTSGDYKELERDSPGDRIQATRDSGSETSTVSDIGFTVLQTARTLEMWTFLLISFGITGAGLLVINNIAQMDKALRHVQSDASQDCLVTIIAFGSATGRMGFGYMQNTFDGRVEKSTWLVFLALLMTCSMVWFAFATADMLFPGALVCGWAYGGMWVCLPSIAKAMFGERYLGQNYNLLNFAPFLGSLVCSTLLAGRLYDKEAKKQGGPNDHDCEGSVCYRNTFLIMTGLELFTLFLTVCIFPTLFKRAVAKLKRAKAAATAIEGEEAPVIVT